MTVSPGPLVDPAVALTPTSVWTAAHLRAVEHGTTGRFDGAALFLDISGFTTLSEGLGRLGSVGTEELVRALNGFFEPAINLIRGSGGEVVAFGGDAITAVWPGPDALDRAHHCGDLLAEGSRERGMISTSGGDFTIAVRIGVSSGDVDVTIGGTADRLVVLTGGSAIDHAVAAEETAGLDEVEMFPSPEATLGPSTHRSSTDPSIALVDQDPARFAHPVIVDRVRRGDTTLIDGHRRVSTVFARIPEPEGGDLSDAISSIVAIVTDLGGEVIQVTGGDKGTIAMLTFGAPTSSPDDARRAVAAGMRFTDAFAHVSEGISVGIGTGTVFSGLVGGLSRSVYTVIGDAVNLAARLMQRAEPGEVLVDGTTLAAARTAFAFEDRGTLRVKGKLDAVEVAHLVGQRRRIWPTNRLATDGPLVGRAAEMAMLERALEPGQRGIRRVVIEGGAGLGKSRLLRAMADRATARGWFVVAGGAVGFGTSSPYAPWQPILRSIAGDDPTDEIARLAPDALGLAPLLGPLVGVRLPETATTSALEGEVRSELADELAVRLLVASARERPLLIQLEDWHWADPSSVRLLRRLSAEDDAVPILVTITRRTPSDGPAVAPREGDVRIELDELDSQATRELAASISARTGVALDADRMDRIAELGDGNPLMVETLVEVGGEPVLTTGLAPLLQARLDRLSDEDLRSLLWTSAFGRPVVADELGAAMAEGGERDDDLAGRLDRLVGDGVFMTAGDRPALGFRHASLREAAYERLSHESRRRVHHGVAVAIEERDGPAIEIASHLVLTDDVDRQRRWFPRAGGQARAAWAVDDAVSWFERALDVGETTDEVRIELAELLTVRGDLDRVAGLVAEPSSDPSIDRRRLTVAGERAMITGANEASVDMLTEAMRIATSSGSQAEACASGELLSRAMLETGRIDDALETTKRLTDGVEPTDHDTMARAIGAYGVVQIMLYDLAGAVATLRRAVAHAQEGQDRVRLIHLLSDLAAAHAMSGDASSALEAMLAAREVAEDIGYRRHLALSVSNEAQLRLDLGDGPSAITLSLRGLHEAVALGDVGLASDNLLRLADDPAIELAHRHLILERSVDLETDLGRPHTKVEYDTVGIEVAAADPAGASVEEVGRVLADAQELGRPDLELRVLQALGDRADLATLVELASRLDDVGDRFLADVAIRRVSGDTSHDDELRRRGLDLYRTTPYATYRHALEELGDLDPDTDVVVPPFDPAPDDPSYDLEVVLGIVDRLIRERYEG